MSADDAAVAEITKWRDENNAGGTGNDVVTVGLLNNRIRQRVLPVRQAYEAFLAKNPRHTNTRVAYAAFLEEISDRNRLEFN